VRLGALRQNLRQLTVAKDREGEWWSRSKMQQRPVSKPNGDDWISSKMSLSVDFCSFIRAFGWKIQLEWIFCRVLGGVVGGGWIHNAGLLKRLLGVHCFDPILCTSRSNPLNEFLHSLR
jgi:hypothetical protein